MIRLLIPLAAMLTLALGPPSATLTQDATPAANPTALQLVEERVVQIEDGQPLALSPDGRWLAAWREAGDTLEICAYETATLAADRCAPFAGHSVATDSAVWSPDGTRVAFTEDALRQVEESDLWVFDVAAGTVTNLTDDGQEGRDPILQGTGVPVDLAPAWSPNGAAIVFARSVEVAEDVEQTALYRILADGGEPQEFLTVAEEQFAVPAGIRWLADGTILYSIDLPSPGPANGLWAVSPGEGGPRQLVDASESGLRRAILVAVSARGQALLMTPPAPSDLASSFALVDLATGQLTPVESARPAGVGIYAAAFSPDGTRLLLTYQPDPVIRLAVRDLGTGAEQVLSELERPIGTQDYRSGLDWAANDLVFGPSFARSGTLLRLTTG